MLRLLALVLPALIITAGFAAPLLVLGAKGYVLAIILVGTGSVSLWWIEKKATSNLEKETTLNNILNTKDGPDN